MNQKILVSIIFLFSLTAPLQTVFSEEKPAEVPVSQEILELKKELGDLKQKISDSETGKNTLNSEVNAIWTCIAAFLVFFMQAGFALVEAGFSRSKNVVNILMKNLMDMSIGSIIFWLVGFGVMFGPKLIPDIGFGFPKLADSYIHDPSTTPMWGYSFFLFQLVFCATAATIVSGAMAERTVFISYAIFSVFITAIVYPLFGSFAWAGLWNPENKGWLEKLGFHDFAGSTVVHSVGGWAGLAGAIVLGPRIGKYLINGKINPILGHNMAQATLGVFILWVGWFGFNPGSTTSVNGGLFAPIAVNTQMAAASGATFAMITTWILFRKPEIGLTLNGALAGLVAITAGCDVVSIGSSILIGGIAGILIIFSVLFFDLIRVDDPVGAVSVHGVCGAWGTIAVGFFAKEGGLVFSGTFDLLLVQLLGVGVAFVVSFFSSLLFFYLLKFTIGLRVSEDEEITGLDILEHGNEAYPVSK